MIVVIVCPTRSVHVWFHKLWRVKHEHEIGFVKLYATQITMPSWHVQLSTPKLKQTTASGFIARTYMHVIGINYSRDMLPN